MGVVAFLNMNELALVRSVLRKMTSRSNRSPRNTRDAVRSAPISLARQAARRERNKAGAEKLDPHCVSQNVAPETLRLCQPPVCSTLLTPSRSDNVLAHR